MFASLVAWLVGLQWRQKGHESECALRYAAIQWAATEQTRRSDERHEENVQRFHALARTLERQDDKLDRLLSRAT